MGDHQVTIDWGSGTWAPTLTLRCDAPPDALCHAVYDCPCEEYTATGVHDGRPWHTSYETDDLTSERHYGRFEPDQCTLVDWFDAADEQMRGQVTLPVRAQWEGDFWTFHPTSTPHPAETNHG